MSDTVSMCLSLGISVAFILFVSYLVCLELATVAAAILFDGADEYLNESFLVLQKQLSVLPSPPIGLRKPSFEEMLLLMFAT